MFVTYKQQREENPEIHPFGFWFGFGVCIRLLQLCTRRFPHLMDQRPD